VVGYDSGVSDRSSNPPSPDRVGEILAQGQAAWPKLVVDRAGVERHLAAMDNGGARASEEDNVPGSPPAHAADLYLAIACLQDQPAAIAALEAGPLREVGDFVARIDPDPRFAEEVRQLVREKLLLGTPPERGPRLRAYSGRGPLGGWIRVVAVRVALDLRRARGQEPAGAADAERVAAVALDPEMRLLLERHRGPFQEALSAALEALSARERNLLRRHFVEGYTLEQLATSYQVHRATVARWLAAAREAVLAGVARRLGDSVGLTPGEVDSVARLLASQIDVSLSRLA
jgi:RNA polymerase sigma-70 factor, ECF subfamily